MITVVRLQYADFPGLGTRYLSLAGSKPPSVTNKGSGGGIAPSRTIPLPRCPMRSPHSRRELEADLTKVRGTPRAICFNRY